MTFLVLLPQQAQTGMSISLLCRRERTIIIDAKNAYFHAEEEEIYVTPPQEYIDLLARQGKSTAVMWRLHKQLYGRRRAGQKFNEFAWGVENLGQDLDQSESIVGDWI